ncbi:hypothetical protein AAE478_008743 [Parahypoxylon ruwenzoriense]
MKTVSLIILVAALSVNTLMEPGDVDDMIVYPELDVDDSVVYPEPDPDSGIIYPDLYTDD